MIIPVQYRFIASVGAGLLLSAALFGAGWTAQGWRMGRLLELERAQHTQVISDYQAASADAQSRYRAKEQSWRDQQDMVIKDAQAQTATWKAAADRANSRADSLRSAALNLARSYPAEGSKSVVGSTAAASAANVLADLLGQCGRRVAELASYADAARIAGQACERSYDAVASNSDE